MHFHSCSSITDTMSIGFNLDTMLVETQRVVHADGPEILEGKNRLKIDCWLWPINGTGLLRGNGKAAVVARQEADQHRISLVQISDSRQSQFTHQAVLKRAEQSFDATLTLRRMRGNRFDPQFAQ